MDFTSNLLINVFAITILLVLFLTLALGRNRSTLSTKLFSLIIITVIIQLVADVFGRMDGITTFSVPIANQIGNFVLFLLNPIPSILWILFIISHIYGDVKITKRIVIPIAIYSVLHLAAMTINIYYPIYYSIDANNVYRRGPLFILSLIWSMLPLIIGFILTIIKRKEIIPLKFNSFVFYPFAPVIGTVIGLLFYGYSIILPSLTIGILLVFNGIQNDSIVFDYLTGVYNRRALEDRLRKKIGDSNHQFGAIMLDIDGYKKINDTYGHLVGDRALSDFAKALRQSVHIKDFVARYGGDEFVLVINCHSTKDLENIIEQIYLSLKRLNDREMYPFKFDVSKGYALYSSNLTLEQFIHQLDSKMYEEKKTKLLNNATRSH